ncbi:MAG: hypothetical protein SVV03_02610 [Candidatus Nanohaloarchaea archaeon]|nr:hypothetical protein [Candidatus Nanohaloarchaea archaeon]
MPEDDYQSSIADRKINREDGQVKISTSHEEEVSEKGFVQMFEQKVHKYRQMINQASNLNSEIQDRLEGYDGEMELMHVLDQSQEQDSTEVIDDFKPGLVNSLPEGAITDYVEVQQYQSKKENLEDDLEDLKKDLQDLWPMVQKIVASNRDIEMPKATQSMEGVLDGVQKYFGGDENADES